MKKNSRIETLDLDRIVCDPELKVRVEIDETTVDDYYDAMATEEDVKKFPEPVVYFDGWRYLLVDGYHRYLAVLRRQYKTITVEVIDGTKDEAILAAVRLNMKHGLRFKEGDWEKIITLVASKEQWRNWSNRKLADELHCSAMTVQRYRPEPSGVTPVTPEKRMGKDGKMYPIKMQKKTSKPETVATEQPQAEETVTESTAMLQPTTDVADSTSEPEVTEASLPEPETVVVATEIEADAPEPEVELETGTVSLADDRRRIDLNVKQTQIETTISLLEGQLYEWLEIAQPHEDRDCRQDIAKRLHALADDFMTDVIS